MERATVTDQADPYAVLNLPDRNVSDASVRDAYRKLSRLLHPDKRPPGDQADAESMFNTLQGAYEVLVDPALRQAYDHFGHGAVTLVNHNKHQPESLYRGLTELHDEGNSAEALKVLQIVMEDTETKKRLKEWNFNADVEVRMHACDDGSIECKATNLSLSAMVPLPRGQSSNNQLAKKVQLAIGGTSTLDEGMGSTRGSLTASYKPVSHIDVSSELEAGYKHLSTSISSSTQLANGTGLSAKATRQIELGSSSSRGNNIGLAFTSHRSLSMFTGRIVHSTFAIGSGVDFKLHYGVLSLTTLGLWGDDDGENPPQITAKMQLGTQYPVECSIVQSNLFGAEHRSGKASIAWSPLSGFRIKAMLSRNIPMNWVLSNAHASDYNSTVGFGVETSGLSGLTWLLRYSRPEGIAISIPIFLTNFMAHGYWNKVVWISTLTYLLDEAIEEYTERGQVVDSTEAREGRYQQLSKANRAEHDWSCSPLAISISERHLPYMVQVASAKRRREEFLDGLVILRAVYGTKSASSDVDVTEQLQFWVNDSRLVLPSSPKYSLLGFYALRRRKREFRYGPFYNLLMRFGRAEPDLESDDYLTIRYKYKGKVFELSVTDSDQVMLPSTNARQLGSSRIVT
ncbi:hypothetical protein THAOC_01647 [Thalassiosira oceanica]|uniref:J domain-containing protein n=1 Tax=Thalassiosira oceanica TaxID=159749 RepID=K0TMW5_THAOC|nr:hypothetical protein THAOC_01647 [Thalassiosira oceanica]|eukprot:EJK76581.1 hypothetical protein THAOC_01647 [Thalassiosira oceanica]